MSATILDGITREDVLQAIRDFVAGGVTHGFIDSTKYDLLFDGRRYPPKAILGIAGRRSSGRILLPSDFKGGLDSKCFRVLESLGFAVVPKAAVGSMVATYLLTWNPKRSPWEDFNEDYAHVCREGYVDLRWSCGVTRRIKVGDRVFLLRQGIQPKGIIGSGVVKEAPFEDEHWADDSKTAWFIRARFEVLLNPTPDALPKSALDKGRLRGVHWDTQASGMSIPPEAAAELEEVWTAHIESLGLKSYRDADEIPASERFWEGALRKVTVNAYERDPRARAACIAHYGAACAICGTDFGVEYGEVAKGRIHVHHLRPLSEIREGYTVDPVADLRPVCPNCHLVIHRRTPPFLLQEVKKLRSAAKQ